MFRNKLLLAAKTGGLVLLTAVLLPVTATAHDANLSQGGVQPHLIGPYSVLDTVTSSVVNNATTASYTITVPPGAQDLSHTTLRLVVCDPAHAIVAISTPGEVEVQDGSIGWTTLFGVTVEDNVLGTIGTIDALDPGEVVTLTKNFAVEADSPTENTVTACGTDALGEEHCDTDVARIQILLPAGPREEVQLPRTGFNLLGFIALGLNLVAAGAAMMLYLKRWAG